MISVCQIYEEKTIEVGVYIDHHLYKNMEEVRLVIIFCLGASQNAKSELEAVKLVLLGMMMMKMAFAGQENANFVKY